MVRHRKRKTRRHRRAEQIKVKTPPFQNTDSNPTLIDQIPQDIVGEILSLLPVKSLLRFMCVSKSWLSLISSPDFVKTHLQKSSKNVTHTHHRVLLSYGNLVRCYCDSYDFGYNQVERFLESFSLKSFLHNQVVHSIVIPWDHFYVVDSCNGLFCISSRDGNALFLWNPGTRKYRKLPDSGEEIKTSSNRYGFGFDESTNDYKIVKLGLALLNSSTYPNFSVVISVYSRKTDSWKRIEDFPGRSEDIDYEQKFVNGKMHWLTNYSPLTQRNIVSLDLQTEIYESIQLPFPDNNYIDVTLGSLGGCLGMLGTCSNQWDLWILKEYGVKEPWTHVVNIHMSDISPYSYRPSLPLYMLNNGQILLLFGSNFVLYNPKDQSRRTRDAAHSSCWYGCGGADIYVESLVSPSVDDGPGLQPK